MNRTEFLKKVMIGSPLIFGSFNFGAKGKKINNSLLVNYRMSWERSKTYMIEVAEAMPEEHYSFNPTYKVRTFGEQMLHVAQGIYGFAWNIEGGSFPVSMDTFIAKGKTKEEIINILTNAFGYSSKS